MPTAGHLDIIGGISGDMLIGALLAAGVNDNELETEIRKVVPRGWSITPSQGSRGSIHGVQATVMVEESSKWTWEKFRGAVSDSELERDDQTKVLAVLDILETAERDAHGDEDPHLHELGSTDTIVDIVGAVVGLRLLGIEKLTYSSLPASSGTAVSSHGETPSFAPATMSIIKNHRLRVRSGTATPTGEAVTPTGAALVAGLANSESGLSYAINVSGHGLGSRDGDSPPNALGLWVCDVTDDSQPSVASLPSGTDSAASVIAKTGEGLGMKFQSDIWLIEANIDDSRGEELGYTVGLLRKRALDVWTQPIAMKKSRPGVIISALVKTGNLRACVSCIAHETSTFGVRVRQVTRLTAERNTKVIKLAETVTVRINEKLLDDEVVAAYPEYEDCVNAANEFGRPLKEVYDHVVAGSLLGRVIVEQEQE